MTLSEWLQKKIRTAKKSQARARKSLKKPNLERDDVEYFNEGILYNEGIKDTCDQILQNFPQKHFDLDFVSASFNCPN